MQCFISHQMPDLGSVSKVLEQTPISAPGTPSAGAGDAITPLLDIKLEPPTPTSSTTPSTPSSTKKLTDTIDVIGQPGTPNVSTIVQLMVNIFLVFFYCYSQCVNSELIHV